MSENRKPGYYWVKFYNHEKRRVLIWNDGKFHGFPCDVVHDEIEDVHEIAIVES